MKIKHQLCITALGLCLAAWNSTAQSPSNGVGTAQIPKVTIVAPDPIALAGTSTAAFVLIRDTAKDPLAVSLAVGGTARNGIDYETIPLTVTMPAGAYSIDLSVKPILDTNESRPGNASVGLSISATSAGEYSVGAQSNALVTIVYDTFALPQPTVCLTCTNPASGPHCGTSTFTCPACVPMFAWVNDRQSPVRDVIFYVQGADGVIKSPPITTAPYTWNWEAACVGQWSVFVRATDLAGNQVASSDTVIYTVNEPAAIKLTAPADGATFLAPATVKLAAQVNDPSRTIHAVRFTASGPVNFTALSTDEPYYGCSWTLSIPGKYVLTAQVADSAGVSQASDSVTILVTTPKPFAPVKNALLRER